MQSGLAVSGQVSDPQNAKDHAAHMTKWLPVYLDNQAMSPAFLLVIATVIVDWYMHNYCLLKVFEVRCQHRPKTEFCGLHDNASVQTAATIVDCSQQEQSAAVATLTTPLSL